MFIDASALTAMLTDEEDAVDLLSRMQRSNLRLTSPLAVWEAAIAVGRVMNLSVGEAASVLDEYLQLMEIEVIAVPPQAAALALDAFERYGKGRHAASLNFGDCFAYACARFVGEPLLYKGTDFARTDIEGA